MIDKSEIRRLIPHSGTMCLLDGVVRWDDESIVCITNTHRDANNPLRRDGQLSALHALEYGAQAAAVHGGLRARAAGTAAPPCYLAALREAHLHVARTVTRRAERLISELATQETLNPLALKYANRLSDHLFVLARHLNDDGKRDVLWVPGQNR